MMARLLVAILTCALGHFSSSSSCSSAFDHSCETEGQSVDLLQLKAKSSEETRDAFVTRGKPAPKPSGAASDAARFGKPQPKPRRSRRFGKPPPTPEPNIGSCTVCGDPHVTVFDQAEVALLGTGSGMKHESSRRTEDVNDEFGWGDFWLVKSSEVSMQARYRKVYYPKATQPLNNTYLTAMAVGGPFMRGHRLIVEPRIGSVSWMHPDGSVIELFPSDETSGTGEEQETFLFEHGDLIKARYFQRTAINEDHGVVQGLDIQLPSSITLNIDRFGKHMDLRIKMPAWAGGEGGLDGQCGNFNGDATDDTSELLQERIGYQVAADELLFI